MVLISICGKTAYSLLVINYSTWWVCHNVHHHKKCLSDAKKCYFNLLVEPTEPQTCKKATQGSPQWHSDREPSTANTTTSTVFSPRLFHSW